MLLAVSVYTYLHTNYCKATGGLITLLIVCVGRLAYCGFPEFELGGEIKAPAWKLSQARTSAACNDPVCWLVVNC